MWEFLHTVSKNGKKVAFVILEILKMFAKPKLKGLSLKSLQCVLGEPLLNSDKIIKLHRAAQISVSQCLV